ncbi:triose-phosphate isomerase [Desulfobacterales bacterium HSG16]|nr:triose-phosphate isomerase [Desulfobacterales bacterium HSG16]
MDTRKPLIAGNWKMFKTVAEAVQTASKLASLCQDLTSDSDREVMIAPPFTALSSVHGVIEGAASIHMGAQNMFYEKQGAYTGEISPDMVLSTGCTHVIIGHSERRQYFNEQDETINQKTAAAIKAGLVPILCVGETEKQRESEETFSVLDKQIRIGLKGFSVDELELLVLAYEPVWAIGTGKTATSGQAQEVHSFLRNQLEKNYSNVLANSVRILYGGSVKPDNISELMNMPDVDGVLVGGASLSADTFSQIVHY